VDTILAVEVVCQGAARIITVVADHKVDIQALTPERWADLERVFGPSGAFGGCWCMYFRLRSKDNAAAKASERKSGLKALVDAGEPPGLIGYVDDEPAAWVSIDRRERFTMLSYSRIYKPAAAEGLWSIVCFVTGKKFRGQGLMAQMLRGAVDYARENGARAIEAYPVEPEGEMKGYAGFMGVRSVFDAAGFEEVARLANGRPHMRLDLLS
jgi:GNAT superfamily N-acetyltransferase